MHIEQARDQIMRDLLDPDLHPLDIAAAHNLPATTILDIFESADFQALLSRLERVQERRAQHHLTVNKPRAARTLTTIMETAPPETTSEDQPDKHAATLHWRERETTRKIATAILRGGPQFRQPPPNEPDPAADRDESPKPTGKSDPEPKPRAHEALRVTNTHATLDPTPTKPPHPGARSPPLQ